MKKTYIYPETVIVHLAGICQICNGSLNNTTPTSGLGDDAPVDGGDDPGDFSRRRRSVWDNEEEEEEL